MSDGLSNRLRDAAYRAKREYPEVFRVSEEIAYEAADRIEKLEKNVEDWQRMYREAVIQKEMIFRHQYDLIEKLETALRHIEMEAPRGSFFNDVARKALEGKND